MKRIISYFITAICITVSISTCLSAQETGTITDSRDGKVYKTVKIGTQWWMAENLAFKTESGCWIYDEIKDYVKIHGYLYSWKVANKACPEGWHLPSNQEWWELSNYLGGDDPAGGKLKQTGTTSWKSPNTGATNSSGFTALSSGRSDDPTMGYIGYMTFFWTSEDDGEEDGLCKALYSSKAEITHYMVEKKDGYSVRCIKNQ